MYLKADRFVGTDDVPVSVHLAGNADAERRQTREESVQCAERAAISRLSNTTSSEVILLGPRIPCNCVVKSAIVQGRMVR
jgi:hypothetical protein